MNKLERYAPAGIRLDAELKGIAAGLIISALYSLSALLRYAGCRNDLFEVRRGVRTLRAGAVMPDFSEVLGNALLGFLIVAACMAALLVWHYAYHMQGSKSIYLMRRIPQRWELLRRCAALPGLGALACLAAAAALLLLYYLIYTAATPKECLTPGQWQKLWLAWMGVSL